MSKQTLGWGCALLATVGWWGTHQLTAQEATPTITSARQSVDAAALRINAILDQQLKTSLYFDQEQLDIVLNAIAEEYNLSIVFDNAALDEVAISPEQEVSVSLRNISLRSALNLMLKQPGLEELCYVVEEEVLLITTEEKANETLRLLVYRVDDLLDPSSRRFNSIDQYGDADYLINVIISNLEHDAWMKNGKGAGEIRFCPPGMLVISQTQRVHEQVADLLGKLRRTKQLILSDSSSNASKAKPATQGFAIEVELGENPEQARHRLAAAILKSVDWSTDTGLSEHETWIDVLPNRVLVHHLPTVLNQVGVVLADMRLLDPNESSNTCFFGCAQGGNKRKTNPDLVE